MAAKTRFVSIRLEPAQQHKLILLSVQAGKPGNMSAGLRWALEQVRVSGSVVAEVIQQGQSLSNPQQDVVD